MMGASPAWTWHSSVSKGPALPSLCQCLPGRSSNIATRVAFGRRPSRHFGYIVSEAKKQKQLSTTDEAKSQSHSLALKTADPLTAIGLVHRSLVTEAQNARRGTASTLTRSEVRGGGKKPYAQKGTGNARIGSRRTPLRPGGGVSFGPKPIDWSVKINKKERRLAVATALQSAADDILVAGNITGGVLHPKTSMLVALLGKWGLDQGQTVLLVVEELTKNLTLASRNLPGVMLTTADRLVLSEILRAEKIVIDAGALAYIQEVYA